MTEQNRINEITQRIADLEELKAAEEQQHPGKDFIPFVIGMELEELKEELQQLRIR